MGKKLYLVTSLLLVASALIAQPALHNYFRAIALLEMANPDEASEALKQSLYDGVKKSLIYENLGDLSFSKEDYRKAEEYYLQADVNDPGSVAFKLALTFAKLNNQEKMFAFLNVHLQSDHSGAISSIQSNPIFNPYKNTREWIEFWNKAVVSQWDLNLNEAQYLISTKKYEDAIQLLNSLIDKRKKIAEAYYLRGKAYFLLQEYRFASEDFDKAVALKPKKAEYHYESSRANTLKNDYNKALKEISKAISLNPYNPEYYFLKANILFKKNNLIQAEKEINWYLNYFPHQSHAQLLKARILLETKKLDEALEITRILMQENKLSDELYFIRGNVFQYKELYDQAISDYSMSIDLNPKEYTSYMNRGGCYLMLHQDEKACEDFNRALRLGYKKAYPFIRDYCASKP